MAELKRQYDEKLQQKEELRKKSDFMEMMLDRASQLVSGLIGEKERWENTVTVRKTRTRTHTNMYCRYHKNFRLELRMSVWVQANVRECRLGLRRSLNAGPVCDDSASEAAYAVCVAIYE